MNSIPAFGAVEVSIDDSLVADVVGPGNAFLLKHTTNMHNKTAVYTGNTWKISKK